MAASIRNKEITGAGSGADSEKSQPVQSKTGEKVIFAPTENGLVRMLMRGGGGEEE